MGQAVEGYWRERLADRIESWREFLSWHDEEDPRARATADFETRSAAQLVGPKGVGAWLYSKHPTTEAMCLAYLLPGWTEPGLWHMAHPQHGIEEAPLPLELFAFILAGGHVEAHNAFFERCIWHHVMHARRGWPEAPFDTWRCSAAKCAAVALPRALDDAISAMGLPLGKDKVGGAAMRRLMKPRKPKKAELKAWEEEHPGEEMPLLWHEPEEDIRANWVYCAQDVMAEHALSAAVPELHPSELAIWRMDQHMNWRGARFDVDLARAALDMAQRWKERLNRELQVMTGISAGTKREQVKAWLLEHEGLELPDTQSDTLDWLLERTEMSGRARRVLEIVQQVNKTSTRKYSRILDLVDPDDGRVRDLLMYHGANTGRWAGKGVQVHNFPKGDFDDLDMDEVCGWILAGDIDWIEALYGDVMAVLSAALRGTVIPDEGRDLMVADYSAIEARCVLWLAAATAALDVFRRGEDIYCDMASGIYARTITKKDKSERQFGKQAVLGLGYGMGYITFLLTCRKYGIAFGREQCLRIMGPERLERYEDWVRGQLLLPGHTRAADKDSRKMAARSRRRLEDEREVPAAIVHELALMKYTVDVYRTRYPEVKEMWKDQEEAAIRAVQSGERVECGRVVWYLSETGKFLHCELPSERRLSYVDPEVKMVATSWGEVRPALRYMRVGKNNKWERTATYGGKLVENITQAVARDIMANAMLLAYEAEPRVYDTIISVHDELVAEVDADKGSHADYEDLMSSIPSWAAGCPITAEAERFRRYRK